MTNIQEQPPFEGAVPVVAENETPEDEVPSDAVVAEALEITEEEQAGINKLLDKVGKRIRTLSNKLSGAMTTMESLIDQVAYEQLEAYAVIIRVVKSKDPAENKRSVRVRDWTGDSDEYKKFSRTFVEAALEEHAPKDEDGEANMATADWYDFVIGQLELSRKKQLRSFMESRGFLDDARHLKLDLRTPAERAKANRDAKAKKDAEKAAADAAVVQEAERVLSEPLQDTAERMAMDETTPIERVGGTVVSLTHTISNRLSQDEGKQLAALTKQAAHELLVHCRTARDGLGTIIMVLEAVETKQENIPAEAPAAA